MSHWTTKELRLLKEMHANRLPSCKELAAAFPKHSENAVMQAAKALKLRRKNRDWIKIAHQHFARREAWALKNG